MSGSTCPSCGVAILPGYARCPKCRTALPGGGMTKGVAAGGTALEDKSFPIIPVVGVLLVAGGLIAFFALRKGDKADKPFVPKNTVQNTQPQSTTQVASGAAPTAIEPIKATGPSPETLANDLRASLSKQRLWSDVEVVGPRLDVRSGACEEPTMGPSIDAAAPNFKSAGLQQIRCLDKSGRVVFQRDL